MAANKAATDSKMAAPAPAPAPAAPAPVVGLGGAIQDASDLGPYEDLKPDDEKPQSLISHLVSSLSSGQDLTRVLIPTFFLEPRSFLEKFTDLWAHPQLILGIGDLDDPVQRMLTLVRWYVSGWHIRPRVGVVTSLCKKPYNPILGEEFFAFWDHGDSRTDFISEQVSHHPPVSAIYIENRKKNIAINATIYAKSKFLGNSAACESVGEAYFNVLNRGEEYVMTFPTYYACGLFIGKLRMEIGDKTKIVCKKTGLSAEFEFRTKPFVGGDYNRISGVIRRDTGKKEKLYSFEGKWDSLIKIKDHATNKEDVLFDLTKTATVRKFVAPISAQGPFESRRAWEQVSKALQKHDHNTATTAKTLLEDAQRVTAAERAAKKILYNTKMFRKVGPNQYIFNDTNLKPYDPKEAPTPLATEWRKAKEAAARQQQNAKAPETQAAAAPITDAKDQKAAPAGGPAPAPAPAPITTTPAPVAPAPASPVAQSMSDFFATAAPGTTAPGTATTAH